MTFFLKTLLTINVMLCFLPLPVMASTDFIARAEFFLQEINPNFNIQLEILATDKIPPNCPFPIFDVPNKRKTWGKISLKVTCGNSKTLIPVHIKAFADVAIAHNDIKRGEILTPENIAISNQDITSLPIAPITDVQLLYDAQALRTIPKETLITLAMLKRAWTIKAGETVRVQISGNGFSAHNTGKAINNAYKGDKVRIRLDNKTIIEGIATANGQVEL